MTKYHLLNLQPFGREAVVCEDAHAHGFTLNEVVKYVRSVKKINGLEHYFENVNGKGDWLVEGEFEWLGE